MPINEFVNLGALLFSPVLSVHIQEGLNCGCCLVALDEVTHLWRDVGRFRHGYVVATAAGGGWAQLACLGI